VSGLTVLFVILAVVLTVPVYAFALRRLLGLRLSPLRAWIGGLIALACASPIITAIGSSIAKHNGSWSLLPAAWFVILGVAIALLIGMLVLVIFEALVPSGALPGPLYLIRAWRKRVRRVRRYSQIGRILVRRGMLPYLRGTRRSELHTCDGRAALLVRCGSRLRTAALRSSSSDRYSRQARLAAGRVHRRAERAAG
jgi:ubiquinone biosynthesis protein